MIADEVESDGRVSNYSRVVDLGLSSILCGCDHPGFKETKEVWFCVQRMLTGETEQLRGPRNPRVRCVTGRLSASGSPSKKPDTHRSSILRHVSSCSVASPSSSFSSPLGTPKLFLKALMVRNSSVTLFRKLACSSPASAGFSAIESSVSTEGVSSVTAVVLDDRDPGEDAELGLLSSATFLHGQSCSLISASVTGRT